MVERLTRATVVARAAELADRIGLHELSITKLARELGVTAPGIYRHVRDLGDLQAAIGQRAAHEVAVEVATACTGLSGHDALSALARAMRDWAERHPGAYGAMQLAPEPDDVEGVAAAEELLAVLASALRAYRLRGDDLTDAIRMLRSLLHGYVSLELAGGFKQPRSVDASFARAISGLDRILRDWAR